MTNRPFPSYNKSEENSNGRWFDNRTVGLPIINARGLKIPFGHKASFVALNHPMSITFVNPLGANKFVMRERWN